MEPTVVMNTCVTVLNRLRIEMATLDENSTDYIQRARAIDSIYNKVRDDFGEKFAVSLFVRLHPTSCKGAIVPDWLFELTKKIGFVVIGNPRILRR